MSKRFETPAELPTYEEMQAAMRAGRRLRAVAFAEFFGFGVVASAKKADTKAETTAGSALTSCVRPALSGA